MKFLMSWKVFGLTFTVSAHTCSRDTGGSRRRKVRCSFSRRTWGIQMRCSFSSLACLEEEDMFGCEELITKPSLCDPRVAEWTAGSWCYGSLQMSPLTYVQAWKPLHRTDFVETMDVLEPFLTCYFPNWLINIHDILLLSISCGNNFSIVKLCPGQWVLPALWLNLNH